MQQATVQTATTHAPIPFESTEESIQPTLKLRMIVRIRNPRTYFDPVAMESFKGSVRAQGILQPILVRPLPDGTYELVAGERRYRAAMDVFGEDYDMPVSIKVMTDEQAAAAALSENVDREAMSATEEAEEAARQVGMAGGDREEAARRLGWKPDLLNKRLALMNCAEQVRTALTKREIKLGHAELLAALPKETQEKFLPVIIKEGKSISELKSVIEQASAKLSAAIFDKAACATCSHNSSLQQSMFAESVTDGSCTNSACYKDKTEAALTAIADGLKDEYPVIRIIRVGDNATRVKLDASGENGVGEEQAKACIACADYGAAVSALPNAMGRVFKGQCFNPSCNTKKVAARIKAEQEATQIPAKAADTSQGKAKAATAAGAKPAPAAEPKKAVSVNESDRIKAYREKVWRQAMKKEIAASPEISIQYLIALSLNGDARHIESTALGKAFEKLTGSRSSALNLGENAAKVAQATPEARNGMVTLLAASAMERLDVTHLQQLARFHKLDLSKHWALDAELLNLLTKSEIEYLAGEIGLRDAIGDGFKKLFDEKKSDLIDKLLTVKDFNYSANIPKVLKY